VRETGIRMRVPSRGIGEAFAAYGRRVARAAARIARVYRMLHMRLKDLPGAQQNDLFGRYLSALGHTGVQFEYASSHAARNRIELDASFHYPIKMYGRLATLAKALDAPRCAPRPTV
jgi:hypothetical protein